MTRTILSSMFAIGSMTLSAIAGEATTNAWANNTAGGNAGATARYDGGAGSVGISRTRTQTGDVNLSRGLSVGLDRDGLDVSFSHAIALNNGPAYAGTMNLSIGRTGGVSGSYGGVLAEGGLNRSVEAGGSTRSSGTPAATAVVRGDTSPGGRVVANSHSYSSRPVRVAPVSTARRVAPRAWR